MFLFKTMNLSSTSSSSYLSPALLSHLLNFVIILLFGFLIVSSSSSITQINCLPHSISSESGMSFKRLESGENSEEMTNQCCVRESKFLTVGYGLNSDELRIDVGYCRQTCETTKVKPLKREEFDRFLKKYPDIDPIQIFLSLQQHHAQNANTNNNNKNGNGNNNGDRLVLPLHAIKNGTTSSPIFKLTSKSSTSSCISSICQPTLLRREKHFTLAGGMTKSNIDIIESCDCVVSPTSCSKAPLLITIHPGTPYEKTVDVGQCSGSCAHNTNINDHSNCKPIRNQSLTIDGPNGPECLQTIQECSCVPECFRSREFLKVYDYTLNLDDDTTNNVANVNSTSSNVDEVLVDEESSEVVQLLKEPVIKMIDVGRCGGTCHNTQVASKCLLWSANNTCLSSLYGGQNQCIPTTFVSHLYTDKTGHRHTIFSVISCGCR